MHGKGIPRRKSRVALHPGRAGHGSVVPPAGRVSMRPFDRNHELSLTDQGISVPFILIFAAENSWSQWTLFPAGFGLMNSVSSNRFGLSDAGIICW